MTSGIAGDLIIIVPFTFEHETHVCSPFAVIGTCIKTYKRKKAANSRYHAFTTVARIDSAIALLQ
jgi:hypothetical protein